MNLLQALPRTPLWDRLKREQRLIEDDDEPRIQRRVPAALRPGRLRCGGNACGSPIAPTTLYARYEHQIRATYPNRLHPPDSVLRAPTWRNLRRGLIMLSRIIWHVGVRGDYRRVFWRFALARLRRGEIEDLIMVGLIAHHLILFAREASSGRRDASHYTFKPQRKAGAGRIGGRSAASGVPSRRRRAAAG